MMNFWSIWKIYGKSMDSIVRNRQLDKPLFNDVMTRFINIVKGLRRDSDYVTWSSEKERFV